MSPPGSVKLTRLAQVVQIKGPFLGEQEQDYDEDENEDEDEPDRARGNYPALKT